MLALDVVRLEAGLILLEVDYTSARHAMNPEQNYSPVRDRARAARQLRQGRLRRPARARARGSATAARRGGSSAWSSTGTTSRACSTPRACRRRSRPSSIGRRVPVFAGGRQVGTATSARLEPDPQAGDRPRVRPAALRARSARRVDVEWTVEGRRGRVAGDRRRAAVPRPGAQARLTSAPRSPRSSPPAGSRARSARRRPTSRTRSRCGPDRRTAPSPARGRSRRGRSAHR